MSQLGAIAAGRWRYALTKRDLLWAARMVEGETLAGRPRRREDALAVLWTMTSLFAPSGQRSKYGRRRFERFTDLIRAYSQPINPRWLADGELCRGGGRYAGTSACAADRLARRAALHGLAWKDIDASLRSVVLAWAMGRTTNLVPGAIEFAARDVADSFVRAHSGAHVVARAQNTFIALPSSSGRGPRILRPSPSRISGPLLGVGVVAAGLGALFAAHLFGGWDLAGSVVERALREA